MTWRVIHGDCLEVMRDMEAESVDAIVTSPPYADQRDYERAAGASITKNASRRQRAVAPAEFVESFMPVLGEMQRVVREHGSLMLNLGVIMRDGEEHPYADEILARARASGWKLLQRIVWHKPNSTPHSWPVYLHLKHEWVFWLARSVDTYRGYDADTRIAHSETSIRRVGQAYMERKDERYKRRGKTHELHPDGARPASVFSCGVGGSRAVTHTAPMAMNLALQLVSLSCPEGGLVLDPYCGSGTTGIAALRRRRDFIGIEILEQNVVESRNRIIDDQPLLNQASEAAA